MYHHHYHRHAHVRLTCRSSVSSDEKLPGMHKRITQVIKRNVARLGTRITRREPVVYQPTKTLLLLAKKEKWNTFIKRCREHPDDAKFMEFGPGYTVLHGAIRVSSVPYEAIDAVMRAYPEAVYQRNDFGRTILFLNNYEQLQPRLYRLLLDRCTPPSIAVVCSALGHQIPEDLVRANVLPFLPRVPLMQDCIGHTVLQSMIIHQAPIYMIQMLLEACPELIYTKTKSQRTPLHMACYCGASIEMLQLLIMVHPDALYMVDRSNRIPFEALSLHNAFEYDEEKLLTVFNVGVENTKEMFLIG